MKRTFKKLMSALAWFAIGVGIAIIVRTVLSLFIFWMGFAFGIAVVAVVHRVRISFLRYMNKKG